MNNTKLNWTIYTPLKGFLNGRNYVTDDRGDIAFFRSYDDALGYLKTNPYSSPEELNKNILDGNVVIEEYDNTVINAS